MSLLSDNVIPGNHGKIFGTNADQHGQLEHIKDRIMEVKGVKNVIINEKVFPREFTVYTAELVRVEEIEDAVRPTGFHVIPKDLFKL